MKKMNPLKKNPPSLNAFRGGSYSLIISAVVLALLVVATEAFYIFQFAFLKSSECICKFLDIFFRKITVFAVNHMAHLAGINENRFAFLLFILRDKPEGNWNRNTIEKLSRQSNNAFHEVGFDNLFTDITFTTRLRRKCTIRQYETNLTVRGKVINHMLNPSEVGIVCRRKAIFPTRIIL